MLGSFWVICFNWMHYEERTLVIFLFSFFFYVQAAWSKELERSCEIKEEWRVGSRGPSAEDRTPPFNLCNLHDSKK